MSGKSSDFVRGKVALVTGGAQGLGWAVALALADNGARVHVCDIARDRLEESLRELAAYRFGDRIFLEYCDVSRPDDFRALISAIRAKEGRLDILVNNAAFIRWQDVSGMTEDDALLTMRVAYDSMVVGTKAVLPQMIAQEEGAIVNIGSSAGRIFVGGASAAYTAAKAAIDGYTQILQAEMRNQPVAVILVRPTAIAGTDFFRRNVAFSRMPRMGDFIPYSTPPQVASAIMNGLRKGKRIVNVPGYLPLFYIAFEVVPGLIRWIASLGGQGRRDYGKVKWRYSPPLDPR